MAALLGWFTSAFGGIFTFFGMLAGQRLALVLLYVTVYTATVVALASGFKTLFSTVSTSLPGNSYLAAGLSLMPANASLYISALGTAYGLSQLYIFKQRLLRIKTETK